MWPNNAKYFEHSSVSAFIFSHLDSGHCVKLIKKNSATNIQSARGKLAPLHQPEFAAKFYQLAFYCTLDVSGKKHVDCKPMASLGQESHNHSVFVAREKC